MSNRTDVLIVGGGASGLLAAIRASERGNRVILLEKNDRPGRKLLASGNGRCNLMNSGTLRYYGDPAFANRVFDHCPFSRLQDFWEKYGLCLHKDQEGRVYPVTFQSTSVLSVLKTAIRIAGVDLRMNQRVTEIRSFSDFFRIYTSCGCEYEAKEVLIACGGAAQPALGGTMDGYHLLRSLGHTILPVFPALVSMNADSRSISGFSGTRAHCRVSLYEDETLLHEETGEALFTDYGVSGICVMQCARFARDRKTHLEICFLYDVFDNEAQAVDELKRRRTLFRGESPTALLEGIVPSKISFGILKQAGVAMRGETAEMLSDREIQRIIAAAFHYRIEVKQARGFEYAQVTAGGADCTEFYPETMESRIMPHLYATGEVLNVDGDCGGFNLMFAFSSGLVAGDAFHPQN